MAEQNAMLTGRVVPEAALEGSVNMPQFVGGGGVTEEKDPTVPAWAKQPEKPAYTADEVGAISQDQLENAVNQALLQAKETGEFDGAPGDDGFSPVAKVEQTSDGAVIYITDKEGTTEATISNGKDGNPGVYIGSGDMPEGYNVQIDPNGDAFTLDDLIPEGGGGDSWRRISGETFDGSGAYTIEITTDTSGKGFSLKKIFFVFSSPNITYNSFIVDVKTTSKQTRIFNSMNFTDHKNANNPIIGFVDATTPYFTGYIAKTSGYFNQNQYWSIGGAIDPRNAVENITSIVLGSGIFGDHNLGENCTYEIWGVDA